MKRNISIVVLTVSLLAMVSVLYYTRAKRAKRQSLIETAKKDFGRHTAYDSVYAKSDTVSFYKNHFFVGKTVIVYE